MPQHNTGSKKNLGGGKNFKKQGSKMRRGERQNQEISSAFVEDVMSGEIPKDIVVARVSKIYGSGRIQLVLADGKTQDATIRGVLTQSAGAARAPGNPLAITMNSYVVLQLAAYGAQIAAILTRFQINQIKDKIESSRGFFAIGDSTDEDDGFDWDVAEDVSAAAPALAAGIKKGDDDIDIEAI